MDLTEDQIQRYSRHIILKEVGGIGQERLLGAKILVIGAGGLGSPVALYLAAAGIGTIGIIDNDKVDLSNLQRQILHVTETVGVPKTESARYAIERMNPDVKLEAHQVRLTPANALDLIRHYDLVCDGSDNFATRFLVNDACFFAKVPLVSAAILRFDGQLSTFKPHEGGPCYRCIFPSPPPPGQVPTCSQAGVLGAIAGIMGSMQASEALKEILGIGESMSGSLLIFDALATEFRKIKVKRDPGCPLCGDKPKIASLSSPDYRDDGCGG
jgi:molybdopterin/thiamine biosynthesis adenylyltransferase